MARKVVVGVPGSGKTATAVDIVERELRAGLRWDQIGFSSFSRAACLEAAERACKLIGEEPERLQKTGWFRTIHSSALRALGIDPKCIIDPASVDGKKFLRDAVGSERGGEPGTQAAKVDEILSAWDKARARLTLLPPDPAGQSSGHIPHIDPHKNTQDPHSFPSMPQHLNASESTVFVRGQINSYCSIEDFSISMDQKIQNAHSVCPPVPFHEIPYITQGKEGGTLGGRMPLNVGLCGSRPRKDGSLEKIGENSPMIRRYEQAKRLYGRIDYTDILMRYAGIVVQEDLTFRTGYPEGQVPEEVACWLFDEYQDCSPLLARVAERLSEAAGDVWLLGDGYQAIYTFSGASSDVFRREEMAAKAEGNRIVLNRSWRNPDSVIDWGESVLREDDEYESRNPFGEAGKGSVGLLERSKFERILPDLAGTDSLIVSRAWFSLEPIKRILDGLAVPWRSCQEEKHSRWECPAKIAFTLVMRDLMAGRLISEQDWRRVTVEIPAKLANVEMFERGTKAKWKKIECSREPVKGIDRVKDWGATDAFVEFVKEGKWRMDMPLLLDQAIEKFGVEEVRRPSIRLGSVHSVKGLEARNVFCLADSTAKVAAECEASEERCLRYVAITRSSQHYRLVVNQLDISRGKPLFWAAPIGETKYVDFEDFGVKRTKESDRLVQGEGDLDCQVPSGDLWQHGDSGSDRMREGQVRRHRDETEERETSSDATEESGADIESWWDL